MTELQPAADPNTALAQYIKTRRENLGVSRQWLAIQINRYPYPGGNPPINIDGWFVRRVEEQGRVIDPWLLPAIANALGVTVRDLIYPSRGIR